MIYILYSDDYEVYLGGNYRPEDEVLVDRTNHLLTACEALGIPLTLFCDVPCLLRYRELGETAFPDSADLQLKDAVQRGHDVQMHVHPHWLIAGLARHADQSVEYEVDPSRFLLGNWYPDGGPDLRVFCANLFKNVKSYLEDLLAPINESYRCIAFRAGGYGLQPNPGEILQGLLDAGVLIDSSIVPGMVLTTNVNKVDFSDVPRKANYFISPALGLGHASEEGVYEIPVLALRGGEASLPLAMATLRNRATVGGRRGQAPPSRPLGYSLQATARQGAGQSVGGRSLGKMLARAAALRRGFWALELGPNVRLMLDCTRRYISRYGSDAADMYFAFGCHSKGITSSLLVALREYHSELTRTYGDQLRAITYQKAARNLKLL